jgi:hypothetical protein
MSTQRKALCVGVNQYRNFPQATLRGCVPDARAMSTVLKDLYGFDSRDIGVLLDADATKANILNQVKEMIAGAKVGKYNQLVFTMSSHGTQTPDQVHEEDDTFDEAFCPHDLLWAGTKWDPNHVILDDELHDLFVQVPSNVELEVFLDTCHAGTGLKAFDLQPTRKVRYLPPPSFEAFKQVENRRPRGLARRLLEKGVQNHILWAACRADQPSAEDLFGREFHGAFTNYLVKEMRKDTQQTRAQLLRNVRTQLGTAGYSQIPQLETEATKRHLSSIPVPGMEQVPVGV